MEIVCQNWVLVLKLLRLGTPWNRLIYFNLAKGLLRGDLCHKLFNQLESHLEDLKEGCVSEVE